MGLPARFTQPGFVPGKHGEHEWNMQGKIVSPLVGTSRCQVAPSLYLKRRGYFIWVVLGYERVDSAGLETATLKRLWLLEEWTLGGNSCWF